MGVSEKEVAVKRDENHEMRAWSERDLRIFSQTWSELGHGINFDQL